jgi:hypothetical protein
MSDKLTPKSDKCFFVRYARETKGYYFYNKTEGKCLSLAGVFLEKEFVGASCNLEKFKKHLKMFPLCTTMNEPS